MNLDSFEARSFRIDDPDEPERILEGWIEAPLGSEERGERLPAVILTHGFKGFMDWGFFPELARRIVARGLVAVRFNMSGSGIGSGPETMDDDAAFEANTPSREIEDLARVRGFLGTGDVPWIDPDRCALFGHSLGGGVSLVHAAERQDYPVVVTWAAVGSFERYDRAEIPAWRERGWLPVPNARTGQTHRLGLGWLEDVETNGEELDIEAACGRLETPAVLIHGTADESVPVSEGERLASAFAPGRVLWCPIEGAGHTFGAVHPWRGASPALEEVFGLTVSAFEERLSH